MIEFEKEPTSPATTSEAFDFMFPSWHKVQTVLDGTRALREADKQFLPQHYRETDTSYKERRDKATCLNITKLTLESWVGRPFSEPLDLKEDVPAAIVDLAENIDTQGNHVNVFTRNWFYEGLAKAYSHVLVDMPRLEDKDTRTLADDRAEGVRPYWIHLKPEQVFFIDAMTINGIETLTEVRLLEEYTERDGFAEIVKDQIRQIVLTLEGKVIGQIYRRVESSKKDEWALHGPPYEMDIDRIPMVTFYADRTGLMTGVSPLEDLADLNIAHWQSTSDQRACLTTARFPILAVSGGTDEADELVVGPNRFVYIRDPQGRVYYVEHTGAAIGVGRDELNDLARQMGEYGAEFLKKRPNRETATARALDSAESTSYLQDVTLRFMDAIESALDLTAQWMGMGTEAGGSVELSTDFGPNPLGAEGMRTLLESFKERAISREAYVHELQRAQVLDEEFDADEDALRLEEDAFSMSPLMPSMTATPELGDGNSE